MKMSDEMVDRFPFLVNTRVETKPVAVGYNNRRLWVIMFLSQLHKFIKRLSREFCWCNECFQEFVCSSPTRTEKNSTFLVGAVNTVRDEIKRQLLREYIPVGRGATEHISLLPNVFVLSYH